MCGESTAVNVDRCGEYSCWESRHGRWERLVGGWSCVWVQHLSDHVWWLHMYCERPCVMSRAYVSWEWPYFWLNAVKCGARCSRYSCCVNGYNEQVYLLSEWLHAVSTVGEWGVLCVSTSGCHVQQQCENRRVEKSADEILVIQSLMSTAPVCLVSTSSEWQCWENTADEWVNNGVEYTNWTRRNRFLWHLNQNTRNVI